MTVDPLMWDAAQYEQIENELQKQTPTFPNYHVTITDKKYDSLIKVRTERFYIGNVAQNPAQIDSPLISNQQTVWYYGAAINQAIQDVSAAGGGYVHVPAKASKNIDGAYYAGALFLKSNVYLSIDSHATIRFMRNQTNEYYPVVLTSYEGMDLYNYAPSIYAFHEKNVGIGGGGVLDGQEDMWNWRPLKKGYWGQLWVDNTDSQTSYGSNGTLNLLNTRQVPVEKRVFTADGHVPQSIPVFKNGQIVSQEVAAKDVMQSSFRPNFIEMNCCENVLIEQLIIRNTPFWAVHPLNSKNIIIRQIDLYSNRTKDFEKKGWNNDDGIDPESCQNVLIEDSRVTVSDDGVAIKAGRNNDGRLRRSPCKNIIIRKSTFRNDGGESAAISVGSEMSAGVSDIFVHDVTFEGRGLSHLMKLKTNPIRGGFIRNIYVRDCVVNDLNRSLLQLDSNYRETVPLENTQLFNPVIENIFLQSITTGKNIKPQKALLELASSAAYSPVKNVQLKNITYYSNELALQNEWFEHSSFISDFVVHNVRIINPVTLVQTTLETNPICLLNQKVQLHALNGDQIDLAVEQPTHVDGTSFYLTGRLVDFIHLDHLKVRVMVDHQAVAIPVKVGTQGCFQSGHFTISSEKNWQDVSHTLALNVVEGINCATFLFKMNLDLDKEGK